jgi:hypothetical protein
MKSMKGRKMFDTIVAGLANDPELLDLDTTTAEPDLSDLDLRPDLSEPELFESGPPGLADDPGLLDPNVGVLGAMQAALNRRSHRDCRPQNHHPIRPHRLANHPPRSGNQR